MSWLSEFVFDPIKAAIARATTSSNPVVAAVAAQASTTYGKIATDLSAPAASLTANTASGVGNQTIADFEEGLKEVTNVFITGAMGLAGPIGAELAPEAVVAGDLVLTFGEQHALNYVSALFGHAKAQVATVATKPASGTSAPPQGGATG